MIQRGRIQEESVNYGVFDQCRKMHDGSLAMCWMSCKGGQGRSIGLGGVDGGGGGVVSGVAERETPGGEAARVQALKNTKAGFNFLCPVFQ
jgi:hypothetical protein